eukprot:Sspe_Gene.80067::Locus_50369_Transcript_1_1_Confidence_1.000_Length_811::g.80067::m.80067
MGCCCSGEEAPEVFIGLWEAGEEPRCDLLEYRRAGYIAKERVAHFSQSRSGARLEILQNGRLVYCAQRGRMLSMYALPIHDWSLFGVKPIGCGCSKKEVRLVSVDGTPWIYGQSHPATLDAIEIDGFVMRRRQAWRHPTAPPLPYPPAHPVPHQPTPVVGIPVGERKGLPSY